MNFNLLFENGRACSNQDRLVAKSDDASNVYVQEANEGRLCLFLKNAHCVCVLCKYQLMNINIFPFYFTFFVVSAPAIAFLSPPSLLHPNLARDLFAPCLRCHNLCFKFFEKCY